MIATVLTRSRSILPTCALVLGFVSAAPSEITAQASSSGASSPDAMVLATVRSFHDALARGDSSAVAALLADDVRVLESGGAETRAHYLEHHLPGDMAFASAIQRTDDEPVVVVHGDVAWVTTTSQSKGTYRDRAIDSSGAELMVLSREGDAWKIRAVHWSSRQAR